MAGFSMNNLLEDIHCFLGLMELELEKQIIVNFFYLQQIDNLTN